MSLSLPFLTGCGPVFLKKLLKDNPEVVTDSIKANPEEYMEALSEAQGKYRQKMLEKRTKDLQVQREEAFDNPKKPELGAKRVYFGKKTAPITIVEYSDFQCPFCARAAKTMEEVLSAYPDEVRVLYKHLPLGNHPQAHPAAKYYEAIGFQSAKKAKAFHDILFEKQRTDLRRGEKFFKEAARQLKVDMTKLAKDLKEAGKIVDRDSAEASKFGINGTPGFLVAGVPLSGAQPFADFKEQIDKRLAWLKEKGKWKGKLKEEVKKEGEGQENKKTEESS